MQLLSSLQRADLRLFAWLLRIGDRYLLIPPAIHFADVAAGLAAWLYGGREEPVARLSERLWRCSMTPRTALENDGHCRELRLTA